MIRHFDLFGSGAHVCVCVCVWLRFLDYVSEFVLAVSECCAVLELVGVSKATLAMVGHEQKFA